MMMLMMMVCLCLCFALPMRFERFLLISKSSRMSSSREEWILSSTEESFDCLFVGTDLSDSSGLQNKPLYEYIYIVTYYIYFVHISVATKLVE